MKKIFILTLAVLLTAASCTDYSSIKVNSVETGKVQIAGKAGITIELKLSLENPLKTDVWLKSVNGVIKNNGVKFAHIELVKSDTLRASSASVCRATFRIDIEDPMMLMSLGFGAGSFDLSKFTADGTVSIANNKWGARKVRFRNIPVEKLIKQKREK
jgi:LEA14-like dessication related protein